MDIKLGRYRHFKGNEYTVIAIALDTETLDEYVVYRAQYGSQQIFCRKKKMFQETVTVNGEQIPRFQYIDHE